jgi:hypothetical protein
MKRMPTNGTTAGMRISRGTFSHIENTLFSSATLCKPRRHHFPSVLLGHVGFDGTTKYPTSFFKKFPLTVIFLFNYLLILHVDNYTIRVSPKTSPNLSHFNWPATGKPTCFVSDTTWLAFTT